MTVRDWWDAKVSANRKKADEERTASRERRLLRAAGLREMTDDELIMQSPARSSLSYAHHEMEMQRRLKDSIEALTRETAKARWWALWGSVTIAALTVALVALTIVLALKA
jgi:hypothetical protein